MAAGADEAGWTHRKALVNNLRLHWVEAGAGKPVLLLHGFPQFCASNAFPDASHWVAEELPERVTALLADFLIRP